MNERDGDCVVFESEALLPPEWRDFAARGPLRAFNPGLARAKDGGWWFAYRVVGVDERRRIGLCRLDEQLSIVDRTQLAFSDRVRFAQRDEMPGVVSEWFADPRLYSFGGRLFIYWNSGWHEPRNWQFLQELDPATGAPVGPPREMVLRGPRRKLEKNWTLFQAGDGAVYCVYSVNPHRILRAELNGNGSTDVVFDDFAETDWMLANYPPNHGGLRGGAPPVQRGGEMWSFCHTVHDSPTGYRYALAAYRFSGDGPFAPTFEPVRPIEVDCGAARHRAHARLNPAVDEVIYPCGAAWDDTRWLISHGINDERCAIAALAPERVTATLSPRSRSPESRLGKRA